MNPPPTNSANAAQSAKPASPPGLAERMGKACVALRADLDVTRHINSDGVSYVIRDPVSFQHHAFSFEDYQILCRLSDKRPLGELFAELCDEGTVEKDQEEAFYNFIVGLHRSALLSLPLSDEKTILKRREQLAAAKRKKWLMAPFNAQIPLWNPDRFLSRTLPLFGWLYTKPVLVLWSLLMVAMLGVVVIRWGDLVNSLSGLFQLDQLFSMWVALIVLKLWHEMGHGYACKRLGGTVPETGVMLIVLTPCAYVDASCSWSFQRRRDRLMVSLGGMYFESMVAAVALLVWASTGTTWLNALAYQVFFLASVVTLGFNLNPLMRFDGYYILSDLLGIPNLRQRANDYTNAVLARRVVGVQTMAAGVSRATGWFFAIFASASAVYKVFIVLSICTVIAFKFYFIGLAMAVVYVIISLGGTLVKLLKFLCRSPETQHVRLRAYAIAAMLVAVIPLSMFLVPVPHHRMETGVLTQRKVETLNAPVSGFVVATGVGVGDEVGERVPIILMENPELTTRLTVARARAEAASIKLNRESTIGAMEQRLASVEWENAQAELVDAIHEADKLEVTIPGGGRIVHLPFAHETGRFVKPGEPIATVASGRTEVLLLVDESTLKETGVRVGDSLECRSASASSRTMRGTVVEVSAASSSQVSVPSLTLEAGGPVPVLGDGTRAAIGMYAIRIDLGTEIVNRVNEHVSVRLAGRTESLAATAYRSILRFRDRLHLSEGNWGESSSTGAQAGAY